MKKLLQVSAIFGAAAALLACGFFLGRQAGGAGGADAAPADPISIKIPLVPPEPQAVPPAEGAETEPRDLTVPQPLPEVAVTPPAWADAAQPLESRVQDLAGVKTLDVAQVAWARRVVSDMEEYETLRHEAAEALLRSGAPELLPLFLEVLGRTDETERYRGWTVQHLGSLAEQNENARHQAEPVLRRLLDDRSILVQREALLALTRIGSDAAAPTVLAWLEPGQEPMRRDMALRCALQLDLRQALPQVRQALNDDDTTNRIAAMLVLSSWGDQESRAAIAKATRSEQMRVRRAAKAALARLDAATSTSAAPAPAPLAIGCSR